MNIRRVSTGGDVLEVGSPRGTGLRTVYASLLVTFTKRGEPTIDTVLFHSRGVSDRGNHTAHVCRDHGVILGVHHDEGMVLVIGIGCRETVVFAHIVMLCYVLVSGELQAAELTVSTKLHLPQSLVTHLNSIIII